MDQSALWARRSRQRRRPGRWLQLQLEALLTALPADGERFRALCAGVPDWTALWQHAERHAVAGLLWQALRESGYALAPATRVATDRQVAIGRLLQARLREGVGQVFPALGQAGIQAVALKGPVLAERLYRDPSLRFSGDLDILVLPRDLDRAAAVVESLGYRPRGGRTGWSERTYWHHVTFQHEYLPPVELHFHLSVAFGVTIPAAEFLSRAMRYQTQDRVECSVLSTEDEALFLCLHAAKHGFARFCWLYDIWTFLRLHPEVDWEEVYRRAEKAAVWKAVTFSLRTLGRRLNVAPGPPPVTTATISHRWASLLLQVWEAVARYNFLATIAGLCFQAALCDRGLDALRLLTQVVWRRVR